MNDQFFSVQQHEDCFCTCKGNPWFFKQMNGKVVYHNQHTFFFFSAFEVVPAFFGYFLFFIITTPRNHLAFLKKGMRLSSGIQSHSNDNDSVSHSNASTIALK